MKILLILLNLTYAVYVFPEKISNDKKKTFETTLNNSEDYLSNDNDDYDAINIADEHIMSLEDDRSRTRNFFCKVNKKTKRYVRKCSSFKRKRVRALCKKIRINVCSNQQKLVRIGDESEYDLSDLLLNMEDEVLMADRPAIIKIICQVDKTKSYVRECSSFKRKKVKNLCQKARRNYCGHHQNLFQDNTNSLVQNYLDFPWSDRDGFEFKTDKTDFTSYGRLRIRKFFCQVNKTTESYDRKCSSFESKIIRSLCLSVRENVCETTQLKLIHDENNLDFHNSLLDTTLVANDVDKLNSEEAEDNYLKTDMSGIIKLFCQVDKTTKNYVRKCSFFKRKRVQKICEKTRKNFCSSLHNLFYDESNLDSPYKQPGLIFNGDDRKDLVNKHTYAKFQYLLCEVFEFGNFNCISVRNSKLRKFCHHLQKKNYCGKGQFYGIGDENSDQ